MTTTSTHNTHDQNPNLPPTATLTCYTDDARLVVNSELRAFSSVYAAGSVAKRPCPHLGKAVVTGGGGGRSDLAGTVAACNMARRYHDIHEFAIAERHGLYPQKEGHVRTFPHGVYATWRTDVPPLQPPHYNQKQQNGEEDREEDALSLWGVRAFAMGECDAESMATHGFWWTNRSTHRRDRVQQQMLQQQMEEEARLMLQGRPLEYEEASDDEEDDEEEETTEDDDDDEDEQEDDTSKKRVILMTRKTARSPKSPTPPTQPQKQKRRKRRKPVYGTGILFYLDRSGYLRGILTWGMPFTSSPRSSDLNPQLLQRMQDLLASNGAVAIQPPPPPASAPSALPVQLTVNDLAHEAQSLLSLACSNFDFEENIFDASGDMVRPLHRYVPAKLASTVEGVGVLKRRDVWGVDQDIFLRHDAANRRSGGGEGERWDGRPRPPSLITVYPMDVGASPSPFSLPNDLDENPNEEELAARPSKEEPLWLRPRYDATSAKEKRHAAFQHYMRKGQFRDGTDALSVEKVRKGGMMGRMDQWWNKKGNGSASSKASSREEENN